MNPVYILPFAVTHPRFDHVLLKDIQVKYHVDRPYFFCPNQVWAHKNHLLVLKAVKLLAEAESDVLVLFSGKEKDHRNPALFGDLQKFIKENNLSSHVRFLGFIDRTDQLALMRYARCVIQPSLFEGWSTVVEDAKAMGQYILASNLPVHREQLKENVTFFDPADPAGLMELMKNYSGEQRRPPSHDYRENIVEFGADFLRIVASLMQ
jgi:glycosyltransferase involved in cell wall biosynthesis